jgi:ubiquinone/menaquinone biosynthesis C-methylase UbiE
VHSNIKGFINCSSVLLIFHWHCQFQMVQDYFEPVAGGILLDVSCGSGLFTRKFAKSRTYSAVIALDFSENMLHQCYGFTEQDDALLNA